MRSVLIICSTLLFGSAAYAADCYVLASYSDATYRDTELSYTLPGEGTYTLSGGGWQDSISFMGFSFEYEVPEVTGSVAVSHYDERVYEDTHSEPASLGAGCRLSRYIYIEGAYQYDMRARIDGRVGYSFAIEGEEYRTRLVPYSATVDMESFSASLLGVVPLDDVFSLTARAGVLRGDVTYSVTFPGVPGEHVFDRDTVWMPILGAGAMLQLHRHVSVGLEYVTYDTEGTSSLVTGTLRVHF